MLLRLSSGCYILLVMADGHVQKKTFHPSFSPSSIILRVISYELFAHTAEQTDESYHVHYLLAL